MNMSPDPFLGKMIHGYSLEECLGRGSVTAVYLARTQEQASVREIIVTVPLVPEELPLASRQLFRERFLQTAERLVNLRNPHLLPYYGYGEEGGQLYLLTPHIDGEMLALRLQKQPQWQPEEVLPLLRPLASAIDYLHEQGFVYEYLNPTKILMPGKYALQITGTALSQMLALSGLESGYNSPFLHLRSMAGTYLAIPEYLAPEVVRGATVDGRADVYSFAVMIYELLAGHPPFRGRDYFDTALQHIRQPLPSLHEASESVPVALELLLNKALHRNPKYRFQKAMELVEGYERVLRQRIKSSTFESSLNTVEQVKMIAGPAMIALLPSSTLSPTEPEEEEIALLPAGSDHYDDLPQEFADEDESAPPSREERTIQKQPQREQQKPRPQINEQQKPRGEQSAQREQQKPRERNEQPQREQQKPRPQATEQQKPREQSAQREQQKPRERNEQPQREQQKPRQQPAEQQKPRGEQSGQREQQKPRERNEQPQREQQKPREKNQKGQGKQQQPQRQEQKPARPQVAEEQTTVRSTEKARPQEQPAANSKSSKELPTPPDWLVKALEEEAEPAPPAKPMDSRQTGKISAADLLEEDALPMISRLSQEAEATSSSMTGSMPAIRPAVIPPAPPFESKQQLNNQNKGQVLPEADIPGWLIEDLDNPFAEEGSVEPPTLKYAPTPAMPAEPPTVKRTPTPQTPPVEEKKPTPKVTMQLSPSWMLDEAPTQLISGQPSQADWLISNTSEMPRLDLSLQPQTPQPTETPAISENPFEQAEVVVKNPLNTDLLDQFFASDDLDDLEDKPEQQEEDAEIDFLNALDTTYESELDNPFENEDEENPFIIPTAAKPAKQTSEELASESEDSDPASHNMSDMIKQLQSLKERLQAHSKEL